MDPFWTPDENQLIACDTCGATDCTGHNSFLNENRVLVVALVSAAVLIALAGVVGFAIGRSGSGNVTSQSSIVAPSSTVFATTSTTLVATTTTSPPVVISADEQQMIDAVNRERISEGVTALEWCPALGRSAREHSEDMANRDFYDHVTPEGLEVWDRAKEQGYENTYVGENIAVGQKSIREVMKDWMNSEGHRENILSPDYTHFGYGRATGRHEGDSGYIYWTQNFGAGGVCNSNSQ
jgi:uncharacterized protein YkwD